MFIHIYLYFRNRCPSCTWELDEDGNCINCGLEFRQAARSDNESSASSSSSSSDDEEDDRLGGFIVSDVEVTHDDMDDSDEDDTSDSDMSLYISGP